jgi:hypothetical protein
MPLGLCRRAAAEGAVEDLKRGAAAVYAAIENAPPPLAEEKFTERS